MALDECIDAARDLGGNERRLQRQRRRVRSTLYRRAKAFLGLIPKDQIEWEPYDLEKEHPVAVADQAKADRNAFFGTPEAKAEYEAAERRVRGLMKDDDDPVVDPLPILAAFEIPFHDDDPVVDMLPGGGEFGGGGASGSLGDDKDA